MSKRVLLPWAVTAVLCSTSMLACTVVDGDDDGSAGVETGDPGSTGGPTVVPGESGSGESGPGESGPGESGSGESGSGESGSGGVAPCLDEYSECGAGGFDEFGCKGPFVCEAIEATRDELGENTVILNPAAIDCVVSGLREATTGQYGINIDEGLGFATDYRLEVLADGTLITNFYVLEDKCATLGQVGEALRPADEIDACLDAAMDDAAQLSCLINAGDPEQCVPRPTGCP